MSHQTEAEERKWDCFVQNLLACPSSQPSGIFKFISAVQLELKKPGLEIGSVMRGLLEPRRGRGTPFWKEVAQCRAGPLLCGHGFPEAQGAHPGKRPCSLALSAVPPQGDFIPFIVCHSHYSKSGAQDPARKRMASNTRYFPPAGWCGGEVPSLVHTQVFVPVPDDSIVISSFFWCSCFVSKTRKRSSSRDRCLDET